MPALPRRDALRLQPLSVRLRLQDPPDRHWGRQGTPVPPFSEFPAELYPRQQPTGSASPGRLPLNPQPARRRGTAMSVRTVPPNTRRVEDWLAWMADQPSIVEAYDIAVERDMGVQLVAYLVGMWERQQHHDTINERFSARLAEALS